MDEASGTITKWKSYPEYKDSGVEWLGEVPVQWQVKRLKFIASEPLKYGANESAELNDPELPRYIRITDIRDDGTLIEDTFKSLPEETAKSYLLKPGDLLFARSGATVGKSFIYRATWGRACFAGYLIRLRINQSIAIPEFVSYFVNSSNYWIWLSSIFIQSTIQNVSAEKYSNLFVAIPKLDEQRSIAAFLDRKTAKIDALIDKKEKLIDLLQEKRAALINHVVTKGLDPSVPMKDSGVEWLREMPVHWQVLKFSREIHIAKGQIDPEDDIYSSLLLIAPNHIESCTGRLLLKQTAEEQGAQSGKYMCRAGEVIYSKIRPALAKVTIAPSDCLCSADMYPLNGNSRFINPYLFWLFLSNQFTAWSILEADRVAMPKINRETLNELKMPTPPLQEQNAIADYLDNETGMINKMITKVEVAIERLQEYRTALISTAVTGKIDVRNETGVA